MIVRPRSKGGVDYRCGPTHGLPCSHPTTIKGNILDAAVWQRVRAIITDPLTVSRELERVRQSDPTTEDLRVIDRLVSEVERQRSNLTRAIAMIDDPDTAAPLMAQLRTLSDRRRALEGEQQTLQERQAVWQSTQADLDHLAQWCSSIAGRVDELSWEQRRMALTALNLAVTVYPKSHEPRFVITADIDIASLSNTT